MEEQKIIYKFEHRQRLDEFLLASIMSNYSRSQIKKNIDSGKLSVNKKISKKPGLLLKKGDSILFKESIFPVESFDKEKMNLDILYEDDDVLFINKPAGVAVHPGAGNITGTIASGILNYLETTPLGFDKSRPGIVHRLDKDTSGVLLIAKNVQSLAYYSLLFKNRMIKKQYIGYCYGWIGNLEGTINEKIIRNPKYRRKMSVSKTAGRNACTDYKVIKYYTRQNNRFSLCRFIPRTGRTHQIRVHLKYINSPIVGDSIYAPKTLLKLTPEVCRQLLHAKKMDFADQSGRSRKITAPLPKDFIVFQDTLKEVENDVYKEK